MSTWKYILVSCENERKHRQLQWQEARYFFVDYFQVSKLAKNRMAGSDMVVCSWREMGLKKAASLILSLHISSMQSKPSFFGSQLSNESVKGSQFSKSSIFVAKGLWLV